MKSFKLSVDYTIDYFLLAIVCHFQNYRLCHKLNKALFLDLEKQVDFETPVGKEKEMGFFSYYSCHDNEGARTFELYNNKGSNGKYLCPELKNIDYFLKLSGVFNKLSVQEILKQLLQIEMVTAAYEIKADNKVLQIFN